MTDQFYDIAATAGGGCFDELFSPDYASPIEEDECGSYDCGADDAKPLAHRIVSTNPMSPPRSRRHATMPTSPCFSEDTSASMLASSITGRFTNIEDYYHVDPRVLGAGRHGSVRECVDRITGHRYAVKSMRKADPEVSQGTLAREISVLRRIRGVSRAIDLVDVHEDEEYLHLITGLCEGGELFDRISERADRGARDANAPPCFCEAEAARILRQVLVALQELHRRGIVHRDVKPENILLETADEDSPIRLVDFGLAREHGLKGRLEPPMTSVVGTPYYIAPEVLKGRYDKSCDLWSAGIVAYLLLCGYPPFNGADGEEIHEAVLRGRYRFPSAEWKRTSREARDFVRRLLQRDPEKRMDVRQALRHPWMRRHAERDAQANDECRQDESSGTRGGPSSRVDAMDCRS